MDDSGDTRRRWNLLLVTVDDMGWSSPGFMGGLPGLTPNLDALAERSHRFVNNRTVVPICQPAREAIMTGLLPHRSGATGFTPVRDGIPTLVSILEANGYCTGVVHKVDHMEPPGCFPWSHVEDGKDRSTEVQAAGLRAIIAAADAAGKPFFANCNINDPHRPFYGSKQSVRIDGGLTGPYAIDTEVRPADVNIPAFLDDLPAVRTELAQYSNSVRRLDISLANILVVLDEEGRGDNTIIVFCSDHGMPFPFGKSTCYDGGTRVPALISWPGLGQPRTFENLTTNMDLLPTVLDLMAVPAPPDLDGHSWLPLIRGARRDVAFVVTYVNTVASGRSLPMRAIQDTRYSLIFSPFSGDNFEANLESMKSPSFVAMEERAAADPAMAARVAQLRYGIPLAFYDLEQDLGQRVNLVDAPEHRDRVDRMKAALLAEMARTGDPQLDNFRAFLAGKPTIVEQNPRAFRSTKRRNRQRDAGAAED